MATEILQILGKFYGTSGTVTLTAANWTDGTYTLTVEDMGENDAIHFSPSTKEDKTALADVFVSADGQTVTFTADKTPTADITLNYFIARGC